MMFEPKKLHPLSIAIGILGTIKELFVPIVLFVFIGGKKGGSFFSNIPLIALIVIFLFLVISDIIRWFRFTYWLEGNELRIKQGLFVRKKRYIPFERIQSLNLSENIFHRPFQLVKVKIETAGLGDKSEAELTAIKKSEAHALQQMIMKAKQDPALVEGIGSDEPTDEKLIYKITLGQLFFLASTSGGAGVVISAFLAFILQFEHLIPYEKIFAGMQEVIRFGFVFVSLIVLVIIVIAWLISVLIAFLKYNDFTVKKVKDDLVITRGLIEKRTTTVPLQRIQAIKMSESPIRQPFGYASVSLENAGGSVLEQESASITLLPVVKRAHVANILGSVLTDYEFETEFNRPPKRAARRYLFIKVLVTLIVTVILACFFWPYGLLGSLLILGAAVWGYAQYRSAGWQLTDQQLTMRYRLFQQQTMFMRKNRIQSLKMTGTWFQKRVHLAGIEAFVKSGEELEIAHIRHLDRADALTIYSWYRHKVSKNE